jgi:phenylalanyl-tRNA synthetase beta chain
MRIPYTWLKDYVDIALGPEELAERLTMAGLEVDRVDYGWPGIVTAEITGLEHIKGSDHLSATRVTTGTEELSVVCGARNIKLHDKVPLARIGAKVGAVEIAEKKAMGVLSQGMLCSPRELGLGDDHSGILILPPDTPLGVPLGKIIGQPVIELDIKAHRGDLFSVVGVAREVAAFTGATLRPPTIAPKEKGTAASKLMKLEVRDPDLCPRYTARVVRNVTIGPSPQWMADRLTLAGMRPINNVVDVTNYVMLELGQPLHAFDYDKVADHTIIVRRAHPGEELTTLDGVTRHLTAEMLLITDPAGPNVIAGIFGGARVEVSEGTANVLLEAAHFNPISIRRTAVALGLRTESSSRFEKNPDIELTAVAIDRAAQLLTELAGGQVAPGRVDFYPEPVKPRIIDFDPGQVAWLTGMTVTRGEVIDTLRALGFGVEESDDVHGRLRVTVPTWRGDVEESADLVEEVARIVGFDRIPSLLPTGPLPELHHDEWYERESLMREVLVGAGLSEALTYTLTNRMAMARLLPGRVPGEDRLLSAPVAAEEAQASGTAVNAQADGKAGERRQLEAIAERLPAITIRNPLSADHEALRLTLMSGLLAVLRENAKHEDAGLWFFELGRRYLPTPELAAGEGLAEERRTLGIALTGRLAQSWLESDRDADFYDLKGVVETLLGALKVHDYRFVPAQHPSFHPSRCAVLEVAPLEAAGGVGGEEGAVAADGARWQRAAILGEVHPDVAERFDLPKRAYLLELDLERLFLGVPERVPFQAIPRFPAAQRDLALVVAQEVAAAEVESAIRAGGGALLRDARLFDVYTGEGIPTGKKSLAYRVTYQAPDRTLTESEIEQAQSALVAVLRTGLGAELRG